VEYLLTQKVVSSHINKTCFQKRQKLGTGCIFLSPNDQNKHIEWYEKKKKIIMGSLFLGYLKVVQANTQFIIPSLRLFRY